MSMDEMYTPGGWYLNAFNQLRLRSPSDVGRSTDLSITANGPHEYPNRSLVGKVSQGVTPERAFNMLQFFAASDQPQPVFATGDTSDAQITLLGKKLCAGPVTHYVFPEALTIVNTTLPDHVFHPGNVFRRIVQDGDDIYVETKGYGVGPYADFNATAAPLIWNRIDSKIREQLNKPFDPTDRGGPSASNATDTEANGRDYGAVWANQADLDNAARIYFGGRSNSDEAGSD